MLSGAQIETAKRVAVVLREEAVFGKDDPRLDMVPHNLARRHSFDWRAALDTDSAPPLAAVDLWGLLQLLAVQFEPGSPGKGGRGAGAAAEAQLNRLEREAARIEGLFSVRLAPPPPRLGGCRTSFWLYCCCFVVYDVHSARNVIWVWKVCVMYI